MSVDELAVLDGGKCILQLRGVRPFLSNKYDLTKHPLYRYTANYDKKYAFSIPRWTSRATADARLSGISAVPVLHISGRCEHAVPESVRLPYAPSDRFQN